jgi:hypothetical protein
MRPLRLRDQLVAQVALVLVGAFVLIPIWALLVLATDAKILSLPFRF